MMDGDHLVLLAAVGLLAALGALALVAVAVARARRDGRARVALGLYGLAIGGAFLVAFSLWGGGGTDTAFAGLAVAGAACIAVGSLLLLAGVIALGVPWLLAGVAALLALAAALGAGALGLLASQALAPALFAAALAALCLLLLAVRGAWSSLVWAVLLSGCGAAVVTLLLALRGPSDWRDIPFGVDVLAVAVVVAILVFICAHRHLRETWRRVRAIVFNERKSGDPCVYLPERVSNRPDPCIYSQFLLMQLGKPVTWDNPDVALFRDGVEQYTYDLTVDTTYDVVVTVHNSSQEKPATGTQVALRWIEFGIGGQVKHALATLVVDVPVWPGVATAHASWRTPATPGHYCIEVELAHPQDGNPANNLGWNNTQVQAAASPVELPIRIFNRWVHGPPTARAGGRRRPAREATTGGAQPEAGAEPGAGAEGGHDRAAVPWNLVEVAVDSYLFHDALGKDADLDAMFAPRAPAWAARAEPSQFAFQPGEAYRDVLLRVDAPDVPASAERFNVSAWQGGAPLGGVTVTVSKG
jgi:hypothetical protein